MIEELSQQDPISSVIPSAFQRAKLVLSRKLSDAVILDADDGGASPLELLGIGPVLQESEPSCFVMLRLPACVAATKLVT